MRERILVAFLGLLLILAVLNKWLRCLHRIGWLVLADRLLLAIEVDADFVCIDVNMLSCVEIVSILTAICRSILANSVLG